MYYLVALYSDEIYVALSAVHLGLGHGQLGPPAHVLVEVDLAVAVVVDLLEQRAAAVVREVVERVEVEVVVLEVLGLGLWLGLRVEARVTG